MGDHVGIPGVDLLFFYILFQHFELIVTSYVEGLILLSIILYQQVLLIHITQAGTLLDIKKTCKQYRVLFGLVCTCAEISIYAGALLHFFSGEQHQE